MIRDTVTHSTATAGVRDTRGTRTDELPAWELSLTSASVHHITVGDWWWLWHWNVQGKLVPLKLIRMGVHSNALSSVTKWALLLVILQTGPGNAAGTQSQVIKVIIRSWKYLYKMRTNRGLVKCDSSNPAASWAWHYGRRRLEPLSVHWEIWYTHVRRFITDR